MLFVWEYDECHVELTIRHGAPYFRFLLEQRGLRGSYAMRVAVQGEIWMATHEGTRAWLPVRLALWPLRRIDHPVVNVVRQDPTLGREVRYHILQQIA